MNASRGMLTFAIAGMIAIMIMLLQERQERLELQDVLSRVKLWNDCRPPREDERIIVTNELTKSGKVRFVCQYISTLRDPAAFYKKRAKSI